MRSNGQICDFENALGLIVQADRSGARTAVLVALLAIGSASPGLGQERWNPFASRDDETQQAPTRDPQARRTPPRLAAPETAGPVVQDRVDRRELAPIGEGPQANFGGPGVAGPVPQRTGAVAGRPGIDPWQAMSVDAFQQHLATMNLPVLSWSLRPTWQRLLTTGNGADQDGRFAELRLNALYRSGAIRESLAIAEALGEQAGPVARLGAARAQIALGDTANGCATVKAVAAGAAQFPKALQGASILYAGFCAARSGQPSGATLAASLAREAEIDAPTTIAILEAVGRGDPGAATDTARLTLLDARLLLLLPSALGPADVDRLTLPAAISIAIDKSAPVALRIAAAEKAAGAGVLSVRDLEAAYDRVSALKVSDPVTAQTRRGRLWQAIRSERAMYQRTRDIRAFVDAAKREGFYAAALRLAATIIPQIKPVVEIGWFAETAVESSIAAGRLALARQWIDFSDRTDGPTRGRLGHWRALVDIADSRVPAARRGADLALVEQLALAGRIPPAALHRLATVLDALNYNVPIGLWNAANRTKQPTEGHLPPTGTLSQLGEAAKAGQIARTVLLTLATIGERGPAGSHMLALGDAIRGLKQAGLEADARRLAVEAVFDFWPRTGLDQ